MDSLALPATASAQPEDSSTAWSVSALRFAVELGKDYLAGQAQRKQAIDQRALQLIPLSIGLLGILVTLVYTGKFAPVGGSYAYLWAAATVLIIGIVCALVSLERPEWGYIGMEPTGVLSRYAAHGSEHGFLRAVSDDYQRRIEMNNKELSRMSSLTRFATLFALLGLIYGAMMVVGNQQGKPAVPNSVPQQEIAPPTH